MEHKQLSLGIDVGSTTVKVVLREGDIIYFEEYQRHMSQVRQKTLELIEEAAPIIGGRPFTAALSGSVEELEANNIMVCMECGTCSYNCPAKRRLVQSIRVGKSIVKSAANQKKGG